MTDMNTKKLKIALTASIGEEYQTIWGSGIVQNILFLYQLFAKIDIVEEIYLLDLLQSSEEEILQKNIGVNKYKFINKEFAAKQADIVIEIGTQVWPELAQTIKQRNGKIISLRCGNAYIDEVMGIFFDRNTLHPINNVSYDQIWALPHYGQNSAPMLGTFFRCPVKVVNYIWEAEFVDLTAKNTNLDYSYKPNSPRAKNIAICEPNLNPTKTFHIPLLICEEAYRLQNNSINHVYTMNTWRLNTNNSLLHFVNRLDIFNKGLCTFESRLDIVQTMKNNADIIVSHHWQNGLNNLYFDVLYGGYPLIHNSEFIKDMGYYYKDFNPQDGAKQLISAINHHDENLSSYKHKVAIGLHKYSITNRENINQYRNLLLGLYS